MAFRLAEYLVIKWEFMVLEKYGLSGLCNNVARVGLHKIEWTAPYLQQVDLRVQ